jgi:hypothetical protein
MSIRGSGVRRTSIIALCAAALVVMSGCAAPELSPSGPDEPEVVAAREGLAQRQDSILTSVAMGTPLSVSVNDACDRGSYSAPWGPFDDYDWQCGRWTSWVVGSDIVDPGALIAAYRAHLSEAGCEPDVSTFDQVTGYWATYGVAGHLDSGEPYTVDSLPDASAQCPDGTQIGITFGSSAAFDASEDATFSVDEGEVVEARPHDQNAVRTSGGELIVVLGTNSVYHVVPRGGPEPSSDTTPRPLPCACYSGSECDCPGG